MVCQYQQLFIFYWVITIIDNLNFKNEIRVENKI